MLIWIVVAIIAVAVLATVGVALGQRKNLQKNLRVEIHNRGNVPSRFELRAEDPEGILDFEFSLGGSPLPLGVIATVEAAPSSAQPRQPAKARASAALQSAEGVQQKARQVTGLAGALTGLLGTLGMVLPRSIGQPLLDLSSDLRRGQGKVIQAQQMPKRVKGQASRIKTATGAKPLTSRPSAASRPAPSGATAPEAAPVTELEATAIAPGWVQTPQVEPDATLGLDLQVRPRHARRAQIYSFTLLSRSAEADDAPLVKQEWSGQIAGLSGFRRYHPYLLIVALTVLFLLLACWLANMGLLA